jgi:hypothetical protein
MSIYIPKIHNTRNTPNLRSLPRLCLHVDDKRRPADLGPDQSLDGTMSFTLIVIEIHIFLRCKRRASYKRITLAAWIFLRDIGSRHLNIRFSILSQSQRQHRSSDLHQQTTQAR